MNSPAVKRLLEQVAAGARSPEEALADLGRLPVEELGYATVDHLREFVQGRQEVVLCEGKSVDQVVGICKALNEASGRFIATRSSPEVARALVEEFPEASHNEVASIVWAGSVQETDAHRGTVLVVSAGTSDMPVAEEAAVVCELFGNPVTRVFDVGVAGIHRILRKLEDLQKASVVIVAAGMDGALASVVGGLVKVPVIAVPTSVGYGASFGGVSALLAMLNSCASGVSVVNIDNGFGAAMAADRINRTR